MSTNEDDWNMRYLQFSWDTHQSAKFQILELLDITWLIRNWFNHTWHKVQPVFGFPRVLPVTRTEPVDNDRVGSECHWGSPSLESTDLGCRFVFGYILSVITDRNSSNSVVVKTVQVLMRLLLRQRSTIIFDDDDLTDLNSSTHHHAWISRATFKYGFPIDVTLICYDAFICFVWVFAIRCSANDCLLSQIYAKTSVTSSNECRRGRVSAVEQVMAE